MQDTSRALITQFSTSGHGGGRQLTKWQKEQLDAQSLADYSSGDDGHSRKAMLSS